MFIVYISSHYIVNIFYLTNVSLMFMMYISPLQEANNMNAKQRNFKISAELYDELQSTAKKWNCSVTDLIVQGAKKELAWRKIRDELDQPETLTLDKASGTYQPDEAYKTNFFSLLADRLQIMGGEQD